MFRFLEPASGAGFRRRFLGVSQLFRFLFHSPEAPKREKFLFLMGRGWPYRALAGCGARTQAVSHGISVTEMYI